MTSDGQVDGSRRGNVVVENRPDQALADRRRRGGYNASALVHFGDLCRPRIGSLVALARNRLLPTRCVMFSSFSMSLTAGDAPENGIRRESASGSITNEAVHGAIRS